jgi:dienelactone hydrolase
VNALEQRLRGPNVEIYRYDADHAFMNPTGPGYSAEASAVAWQRCLEFVRKYLGA